MKPLHINLFEYNKWRHSILSKSLCSNKIYLDNLANDKGLYFRSIKGVLNHIFLAEALWYLRLSKNKEIILNIDQSTLNISLINLNHLWDNNNHKLFNNYFDIFDGDISNLQYVQNYLKRELYISDLFIDYINKSNEDELGKISTHYDTQGNQNKLKTIGQCLLHITNHGTHHIGQITTILSQLSDINYPDLDYSYFNYKI